MQTVQAKPQKSTGASLPTMLVYEEHGLFTQYTARGRSVIAAYDRERAVIEAARRLAAAHKVKTVRVVFIIEADEDR
jgi:hypothetical protein